MNDGSNARTNSQAPKTVMLEASLPLFAQVYPIKIEVPDVPMRLAEIVPFAMSICDQIVSASQANAEARGGTVTCQKGCAACCKSYLPGISEPEAFALIEDIQRLPDQQRQQVLQRFTELGEDFESSDAARKLHEEFGGKITDDQGAAVLNDWWREAKRSCPMLEGGLCAMHAVRPSVCREFIAVSNPALCAECKATKVRIPINMHTALSRLAAELLEGHGSVGIIVFPLLLKWFGARKDLANQAWPAPAVIKRFLEILLEIAAQSPQLEGPSKVASMVGGGVTVS